jgi:hypothetical protein
MQLYKFGNADTISFRLRSLFTTLLSTGGGVTQAPSKCSKLKIEKPKIKPKMKGDCFREQRAGTEVHKTIHATSAYKTDELERLSRSAN